MTNPQWANITKRTLDLFGRWGDSRRMLRGMLDHVVPVVVVDRFRDDDEGSIYGIHIRGSNAGTTGIPSCSWGSAINDWECLALTALSYSATAVPTTIGMHIFSPIFPYNPAATISPAGFRVPGLINNRAFTLGTVQGVGGFNASFPANVGPNVFPFLRGASTVSASEPIYFDPPLRIYRDTTLTVQWNGDTFFGGMSISVDMLYRERPKVSVGGV